jgi:hypothetical protein
LLAAVLVVALAGGLLAACAGEGGDSAQPGETVSTSPSPSSPGSSSAQPPGLPPSVRVSPPSSSAPKYPPGEKTITGKPEDGVEFDCLIMRADGTVYLLLGGDRALLKSGRTVAVRGKPNPSLMTTCQQGIPFEVSEVRPA